MINIAVIGCGAVFDTFYIEALRKMNSENLINVAVLVDSVPENLEKAHEKFPYAKIASNLNKGLSFATIDRAIVLTPPVTHASIMLELAEAGVHVYCEKPLTVSPADARIIAETFTSKALLCKVGYVRRLFPNFQSFRELYSNLGSNRFLSMSDGEVFRWPIKSDSIFSNTTSGSGIVWDKVSHNLDFVQWTAGLLSIDRVLSSCRSGGVPADILVEGMTEHGKFRMAVSWLAGCANLIFASDGTSTIETKNGIGQGLRDSDTKLCSQKTNITSYGDAVNIAMKEFFKLKDNSEKSDLATAEQSIILTDFLSSIDKRARMGSQ